MDKEELKKSYLYVGPFIYKDKKIRIFRKRTNYDYAFFFDNGGILKLVDDKTSQELTEFFTPDKIYNASQVAPSQEPTQTNQVNETKDSSEEPANNAENEEMNSADNSTQSQEPEIDKNPEQEKAR